jgi:hypothetical protein
MWILAIVPAVAAAIIGLVTWLSPEIPRWKRLVVIPLTIVTIGAVSLNQWWDQHEKNAREARRTEILETLGTFIDSGESLMAEIAVKSDNPVPIFKVNDWTNRAEGFLGKLGKSYVVRFKSRAGIMDVSWSNVNAEQNNWLGWIRSRLIRLHEFSAEYSGQIPKTASANPF